MTINKPEKADFRVTHYTFHLGDLIGGITNLNDEQFGAYMRLLLANIQAMHRGGLPADQEVLRSYTRMGKATWKKFWLLAGDKFVEENGKIFHPRVKESVNEIINNSNAARASALIKHETERANAWRTQGDGNATPNNPLSLNPRDKNSSLGSTPAREGGDAPAAPAQGFSNLEKGKKFFDVMPRLSERAVKNAKAAAPGWDIYHLAGVYNENIRTGKMAPPDFPNAAFPKWCAAYTKGKPPA